MAVEGSGLKVSRRHTTSFGQALDRRQTRTGRPCARRPEGAARGSDQTRPLSSSQATLFLCGTGVFTLLHWTLCSLRVGRGCASLTGNPQYRQVPGTEQVLCSRVLNV